MTRSNGLQSAKMAARFEHCDKDKDDKDGKNTKRLRRQVT